MKAAIVTALVVFVVWIISGAVFGLGSESAQTIPDFQCPAGQFVTGFKSGKPTCAIVRLPAMATRPHGYGN